LHQRRKLKRVHKKKVQKIQKNQKNQKYQRKRLKNHQKQKHHQKTSPKVKEIPIQTEKIIEEPKEEIIQTPQNQQDDTNLGPIYDEIKPVVQQEVSSEEKIKKPKEKKKRVGRPKKKFEEYSPPVIAKPQTRSKKEKRPQRTRKPTQKFEEDGDPTISKLPESLQDCYKLLQTLRTHKLAWPFIEPVNAIALNLPDYYQIVKNPMDLGTVQDHLLKGRYTTIDSFSNDVKLVWANCFLYNHKDSDVVKMAENLSHFFDEKFKKISENTYEEISYESEQIDIQPVDNKEQTLITPSIQTFEIKKKTTTKESTENTSSRFKSDGI